MSTKERKYTLENLGCANCAAKMERKIRELPQMEQAVITFATKQLTIKAPAGVDFLPDIQRICESIETGVIVSGQEEEQRGRQKKRSFAAENKSEVLSVGAGAALFVAGEVLEAIGVLSWIPMVIFIGAYLLLGFVIVRKAVQNIAKGHVFDEHFLMSLATLAAFAIGDFDEAVGVMLFYRVGELFEHAAVEKSRSQIMDAVDMRPDVVYVVQGEITQELPAEQAKTGDVLLIRPGDRIPLDGVVVDGESRIDTSPVTGEPVPVYVKAGTKIISGCVNTSGVLKMEVEKPLGESMVTRILDSVEHAAASKPKIDRFITRFARVYTPIVVCTALLTAVIPSLITGDWKHWIYTAITFLVISCPCALVLSVPLAFFSGIGAGSKRGILFKGGVALEALTGIRAVVMDKTGTITKGEFCVQQIAAEAGFTEEELLTLAAECEMHSTHPIGNSIVEAARERAVVLRAPQEVEEAAGKGIRAQIENQEVLCGNRLLMEQYRIVVPHNGENAYGTEVLVSAGGRFAGRLVIADTVKPDAGESVKALKSQNLTAAMLTGDTKESAGAVAEEVGMDEVYAQLLPQEKLEKLDQLRNTYGPVMFVGDGINDAPVLAGADVGAAMGSGADAAIEAADVVFMTSSVKAVPEAIQIAKATGRIAMQNVTAALVIKAIVIILGFFGYANMWMAVFADTGVAMLCVLNAVRMMYKKL